MSMSFVHQYKPEEFVLPGSVGSWHPLAHGAEILKGRTQKWSSGGTPSLQSLFEIMYMMFNFHCQLDRI